MRCFHCILTLLLLSALSGCKKFPVEPVSQTIEQFLPLTSGNAWKYDESGIPELRPELRIDSVIDQVDEKFFVQTAGGQIVLRAETWGITGAILIPKRPYIGADSANRMTLVMPGIIYTLGAIESVTVPAGTFEAYRFDRPLPDEWTEHVWVSRNVGVVRNVVRHNDGVRIRSRRELTSMTLTLR